MNFEIEIKGEKKEFAIGEKTLERFTEKTGIVPVMIPHSINTENYIYVMADFLICANEIAGSNDSEKTLIRWLTADPQKGLQAVLKAISQMLELLNVSEN